MNLCQPPECWDYRPKPQHLASSEITKNILGKSQIIFILIYSQTRNILDKNNDSIQIGEVSQLDGSCHVSMRTWVWIPTPTEKLGTTGYKYNPCTGARGEAQKKKGGWSGLAIAGRPNWQTSGAVSVLVTFHCCDQNTITSRRKGLLGGFSPRGGEMVSGDQSRKLRTINTK